MKTGIELQGQPANTPKTMLRLSIQPTYDHRQTGNRYSVSSWVGDCQVAKRVSIRDPFVRHTIHIHWWNAIKCLLCKGRITVRVQLDGDDDIVNDILELDADYLLQGSTRRVEFKAALETALGNMPEPET